METLIALGAVILFFTLISANDAHAQSVWDQCTDGREITRCETYDCPNGDTNNDGTCTFDDQGGRLTDVRNDSFCSNPISGCGEVRYYASGENTSCSVRVEENTNNCDLYSVAEPTFTPRPTATPRPTTSPTPTSTASDLTCSTLIVTPSVGFTPLEVKLEAKASGSVNKIENYQFSFTKPNGTSGGEVLQPSPTIEQTLQEIGTHEISVVLVTTDGEEITSSSCTRDITVNERSVGGGGDKDTSSTKEEELPETGSPLMVGAFLVSFGFAGVYMYDKYRVI